MTDLELDKALALATGWPRSRINWYSISVSWIQRYDTNTWQKFRHKNWTNTGPIGGVK